MKNQKGVSLITLIITIIVVIILAIIILRSGVSNTPDQASFSGFTKDMGELQDNVKLAMLSAKGDEAIRGNNRSEAQLYNFVARGGYDVIKADDTGDTEWLIQADAKAIPCTLIRKDHAKESIGMDLPVITVETYKGTNQELSFFVTPKGTVFCWPPYVYDGKSYVTADFTLENVAKLDATKPGTVTINFGTDTDKDEVIISVGADNATDTDEVAYKRNFGNKGEATAAGVGVWYNVDGRVDPDYSTEKDYRGVASGFEFSGYKNNQ